jgi:hypothetical protein
MDKNLSNLLKWSIENSTARPAAAAGSGDGSASATADAATTSDATTGIKAIEAPPAAAASSSSTGAAAAATSSSTAASTPGAAAGTHRGLDPELIAALLGGPSDADLMRAAIETINDPDPEITLESRLIAFDNFEQLIESIDNANNLQALSLWEPLIKLLAHAEKDIRRMAAWSIGTAVQNNERSQERLLSLGGIPPLVGMIASGAEPEDVRKKVVYALSSACRNYQPALTECVKSMEDKGIAAGGGAAVDASDMEAVDAVIKSLREYKP